MSADRIRYAIENYVPSRIEDSGHSEFDKQLVITIPGNPVSDSRPRLSADKTYFYNPHKDHLKKIMRPLYKEDELLQYICIMTPVFFEIDVFVTPDKATLQTFGKELIESEKVRSNAVQDNDNFEKVHWDVMQDAAFRIILDDRNVVENNTKKYFSFNPRIELKIKFSSDPESIYNTLFLKLIKEKSTYKKFLMSKKNYNIMLKYGSCSGPQDFAKIIDENLTSLTKKEKVIMNILQEHDADVLMAVKQIVMPTKIVANTKIALIRILTDYYKQKRKK